MINTSKIAEFFNAQELIKDPIHVIGCGAVGSHVAMALVQMGCQNIHLWDFDYVEPKNVTNQLFRFKDIGNEKVDALADILRDKDPDVKLTLHKSGISAPYLVNGYIFLCVDNIDLRRDIVLANRYNPNCLAFFDFRMRLTDAQHYFAARDDDDQMEALLGQMSFTHEEAAEATPKSACNVELNVIYTVWNIVSLGMSNFQKFCVERQNCKTIMLADMETNALVAI